MPRNEMSRGLPLRKASGHTLIELSKTTTKPIKRWNMVDVLIKMGWPARYAGYKWKKVMPFTDEQIKNDDLTVDLKEWVTAAKRYTEIHLPACLEMVRQSMETVSVPASEPALATPEPTTTQPMLLPEELAQLFDDKVNDGPRESRMLSLDLNKYTWNILEAVCIKHNTPMSGLLSTIIIKDIRTRLINSQKDRLIDVLGF
jgi:hypothetical protein